MVVILGSIPRALQEISFSYCCLFGVMRKLIADNNIDIQKKMAEWRKK